MAKSKLRILPLGGVGEIGKNMMVMEYGENLLIIDAGLMFPTADMPGVDIVIPDMSYVRERSDKVRGIVITHGHEDHIGGLPYLLADVQAPIYATTLTRGLIEVKLKEHKRLKGADLRLITTEDSLNLGPFSVEFFAVCHSIPDGVGLAVHTPVGTAVHSGDFKFDHAPVDGRPTDFAKLARLGGEGVLVLLSDSTNAEQEGYTPSEQEISATFDEVFSHARGRIIVATFASNISRVQQVISAAGDRGRKVAVVGRSMVANVGMARDLGYLETPENGLVPIGELNNLPPDRAVIVCTGSQGEPTSALVRMASRQHRDVSLVPGDTVVVSATPIPGNEELVHRTLNNLFRLGAEVLYHELADVHVSGHASREEQKLMINLLQPQFFIPIHGEFRHLVLHAALAQEVGIPPENVFVAEDGYAMEFDENSARITERMSAGHVLVDGLGVGDVGQAVLRDRHLLSRDGFVMAVVAVDGRTGALVSGPDIVSRGFVYEPEFEDLLGRARDQVVDALEPGGDPSVAGTRIREALRQFFYQETKRRPVILPMVMEV
ncbi:MAG: ribonuclease J [Anaerolineae bacterium]